MKKITEVIQDSDFYSIHRINEMATISNPTTWEGITNIKKAIQEWLTKENPDFPNMTNLQVIVSTWNVNNPSNKVNLNYAD